jgi:hypothetical protein
MRNSSLLSNAAVVADPCADTRPPRSLLLRVITMSIETTKIANALPPLDTRSDG